MILSILSITCLRADEASLNTEAAIPNPQPKTTEANKKIYITIHPIQISIPPHLQQSNIITETAKNIIKAKFKLKNMFITFLTIESISSN